MAVLAMGSVATYERIKMLYDTNQIDATGVQNAVTKGLLTQEQADAILFVPEPPQTEPAVE